MRSVTHASFTITRQWKHTPEKVFAAFADQDKKGKWFAGPGQWEAIERAFDFRENGVEILAGRWTNGMVTRFHCVYRDIVEPTADDAGRIVYSYVMFKDGQKLSVSQAAIEIIPDGNGTKFILTEYGDYFDGYDDAGAREQGTNHLMDTLEKSLHD